MPNQENALVASVMQSAANILRVSVTPNVTPEHFCENSSDQETT